MGRYPTTGEMEEMIKECYRDADRRDADRHEADRHEADRRDADRHEADRRDADRREADRREAELLTVNRMSKSEPRLQPRYREGRDGNESAPSKAGSRRIDDLGSQVRDQLSPKPIRKLASKPWPVFDDTKNRWDEFRARTVNAARKWGHNDADIAQALHEALPGDAIVYLDKRGVSTMQLEDMLWHLDLLYGTGTKNPELAQTALEKVIRGELEPAYRFGKRVLMLATDAAVEGEDVDLKAQRAFVAGINCEVTAPKLRHARGKLGPECTIERLLLVAERTEVNYQLCRMDPTDTKTTPIGVDEGPRRPVRTSSRERGDNHQYCGRNDSPNRGGQWSC